MYQLQWRLIACGEARGTQLGHGYMQLLSIFGERPVLGVVLLDQRPEPRYQFHRAARPFRVLEFTGSRELPQDQHQQCGKQCLGGNHAAQFSLIEFAIQ